MIKQLCRDAHVVLVDAADSDSGLHARMAAEGPFEVIIDVTGRQRGVVRLFRNVFFHLVPGGEFMRWCPRTGEDSGGKRLARFLSRVTQAPPSHDEPRSARRLDERRLATAIDRVVLRRNCVVVTNRVAALAKLREDEANYVLQARKGIAGKVGARLPATTFSVRCDVRCSPTRSRQRLPATYTVPEMCLREYRDVVCVPGQVAVQGNLLLPDSYRHNQRRRLKNHHTRELSLRFAALPDQFAEPHTLPGPYFYLDSEWPAHFGHAMTEVMSRLWGWDEARRAHPGIKALLSLRPGSTRITDFHRAIFEAHGIRATDVVTIDRPVQVDTLVAATPMFSMPNYVHPAVEDVWGSIGAALSQSAPSRRYAQRIFCSRRHGKRRCMNSEELESVLAGHGFEVVFPEDYPLSEQVAMFRHAQIVAGYAGSGLFTMALCGTPKHVLVVTSESYAAQNEYMISSVLGHRMDILWCAPGTPRGSSGSATPGFNSNFTFDFAREGVFLREVLAST